MPTKRNIAVFDIDGTLFRSSLLIELVNTLVTRGTYPTKAVEEIEKDYQAWLNRRGDYNAYLQRVVDVHIKYQKGKKKSDIDAAMQLAIANHKDKVYRYTRNLLKELKDEGYYLIAISGSPEYMVKSFATYFGFDASFGRVYELKNGTYTGRLFNGKTYQDGDFKQNKAAILQEFLNKENILMDAKNSIAVGDTEGDISLFELVGRPIAFNPSSALARMAQERSWDIIVERKDTIYDIRKCKFIL
jgi:HAD superfamily hydrolase (TIGR01490 family)